MSAHSDPRAYLERSDGGGGVEETVPPSPATAGDALGAATPATTAITKRSPPARSTAPWPRFARHGAFALEPRRERPSGRGPRDPWSAPRASPSPMHRPSRPAPA